MMPTDKVLSVGAGFMSLVNRIQYQESSATNDGNIVWVAPNQPLKMRIFKRALDAELADQYPAAYFRFDDGDTFIAPLQKLSTLDDDPYAAFVLQTVTDLYNQHDHEGMCVDGGHAPVDRYLRRMSLYKSNMIQG